MSPTVFKSLLAFGMLLLSALGARTADHYVWTNSPSPTPPYLSWATAATTIQPALNAAAPGDTVIVTNGIYDTGSFTNTDGEARGNRVAVTNAVALRSVNGPAGTIIVGARGGSSLRGVFLTNGAALFGFTVTGGQAAPSAFKGIAGGVYGGGLVSNCIIQGNQAGGIIAGEGGGVYGCTAIDSLIVSNACAVNGGGASQCRLLRCLVANNSAIEGGGLTGGIAVNCTVVSNRAEGASDHNVGGGAWNTVLTNCLIAYNTVAGGASPSACQGGGMHGGSAVNCTVVFNSAAGGGGGVYAGNAVCSILYLNAGANASSGTRATNCCVIPDPPGGFGNITNDPAFSGPYAGDFHLSSNSPCIDADAAGSTLSVDLDGVPRPLDGNNDTVARVDIGAYEFASPLVDGDQDGMNDRDETVAGTDPQDLSSVLRILTLTRAPDSGESLVLSWPTVRTRFYTVSTASNLQAGSSWDVSPDFLDRLGTGGTLAYTAGGSTAVGYYRVGVHP